MVKMIDINEHNFNEERQKKAKRYSRRKLIQLLIEAAFFFACCVLVLILALPIELRNFILQYASNDWVVVGSFCLIGYLCVWFVYLPFSFYNGYVTERKFGLSTQTLRSWIRDELKGLFLSLILVLIFVEIIYYALRTFPLFWWVFAWLFVSIAMIFITFISPILLMPMFFRFEPLKDYFLVNKLKKLAEKAGIKIIGVYKMAAETKTKKAVGALAGIGKSRRIILSDTLLDNYTNDEIEGVIAHELGHHVHHHIGKTMFNVSILFLAAFFVADQFLRKIVTYFGFSGMGDIASLPLLALTFALFFMIVSPLQNIISRRFEAQADYYELTLVNKPDAFITGMIKLCDQNLRDANPHPLIEFIFYTHPSGKRRIEMAERYKKLKE